MIDTNKNPYLCIGQTRKYAFYQSLCGYKFQLCGLPASRHAAVWLHFDCRFCVTYDGDFICLFIYCFVGMGLGSMVGVTLYHVD
jgi:hypothetical protein